MNAQEEAVYFKARCREFKQKLLESRKALKIAFQNVDNALKTLPDLDLNETFDEEAEMQAAAAPAVLRLNTAQEESEAMNLGTPVAASTPKKDAEEHICRLPRCTDCQPFRATVREAAKLTAEERKMWSREPAFTPEGYWNPDMD